MATASIHEKATSDGITRLQKTEGRVRQVSWLGRAAWCVGSLLIAFSIFTLIDWIFILRSEPARWVSTALFTGTIVVAVLMAAKFIRRVTGIRNVASQLDDTSDAKAERWQTLATANSKTTSKAMLNNVAAQAIELQPSRLSGAPRRLLAIPLVILSIGILGVAATAMTSGNNLSKLAKRLVMPWQPIPLTQISASAGDQIIVRGAAVDLDIQATGRIPSVAVLQLEAAGGIVTDIPVAAENNTFQTRFERMEDSVRYRWVAGDSQTQWASLSVVDYPRIVDASLNIYDPDYTNRPPTQWQRLPRRLEALAGSQLIMNLEVDQPLKLASATFAPRGNANETTQLPLLNNEGRWQLVTELQQPGTLELQFAGSTGLESNESLRVEIVEDELPSVGILSSTDDIALTKEDRLQISFTASDDFGVQSVELITTVTDAEGNAREVRQPFDMDSAEDQRSVVGSFQLDLKNLDLQKRSKVSYRVEASDRSGKTGSSGQMANAENGSDDNQTNERLAANDNDPLAEPTASNSEQSSDLAEEIFNKAMQKTLAQASLPSFTEQQLASLENIEQLLRDAAMTAKSESQSGDSKQNSDNSSQENSKQDSSQPSASQQGQQSQSSEQMLAKAAKEFEQMQQQILDAMAKNQLNKWQDQLASIEEPEKGSPQQRQRDANSLADALREAVGICKACNMQPKPQYAGMKRLDDFQRPCSSSKSRDIYIDEFEDVFAMADEDAPVDSLLVMPYLEQLRKSAETAKASLKIAIDDYPASGYSETAEREVNRASIVIADAQRGIDQIVERSSGTPYAFIGLQCQALNEQGFDPAGKQIETARELATPEGSTKEEDSDADQGQSQDAGANANTNADTYLCVFFSEESNETNNVQEEKTQPAKDQPGFVRSLKRSEQRLDYVLDQIDLAVSRVKSRESLAKVEKAVREFKKIEKAFTVLEKGMPQWLNSPASTFYSNNAIVTGIDKEFAQAYQQYLDDKAKAYQELAEVMKDSPELRAKFLSQQMTQNTLIRDRLTELSVEQENLGNLLKASKEITTDQLPDIWTDWIQAITKEARKTAVEADEKMRIWMPEGLNKKAQTSMTDLTSELLLATDKMQAESDWKNLRSAIDGSLETVSEIENKVTKSNANNAWKSNRMDNLEALKDQYGLLLDIISGLESDDFYSALQAGQIRVAAETASLLRQAEAEMSALPQSDKTRKMRDDFFDWMEEEVGTPQFSATKRLQPESNLEAVPLMDRAAQGLEKSVARLDDVVTLMMDNFKDVTMEPGAAPPPTMSVEELMAMVNQEKSSGMTLGCSTCKRSPELNVSSEWDKLKTKQSKNRQKSKSSRQSGKGSAAGQSPAEIAAMRAVNDFRKRSIRAQMAANAASKVIAGNQKLSPFVLQELDKNAREQAGLPDWNQIPSELRRGILSGDLQQVPEDYRGKVESYFRILAKQSKE